MTVSPAVILIADWDRRDIASTRKQVRDIVAPRASEIAELPADDSPLPDGLEAATSAVVIGGDGTLIRQVRRVVAHRIPVIGINVGRLGFLTEFDVESFARHADLVLGPGPPIESRMLIEGLVERADGSATPPLLAVNDLVVAAGGPFRMIELRLGFDGEPGPTLAGDGMIVATPIGSTAYNASAGGPIVYPTLEAMVLTPLAPHSLAFRPIMVRGDEVVAIEVIRANPGTALVRDGRTAAPLEPGDRVVVRKAGIPAQLVTNPSTSYWRIMQEKLRWAIPPTYREQGG